MSAHSQKPPEILDKIVDVVLSYKPKKILKRAKKDKKSATSTRKKTQSKKRRTSQ